MTDFETKVLQVIQPVLSTSDRAEWTNGTLFVLCSDETKDRLHEVMYQAFRCRIISSKWGREHAFDFA
jgi:hypothetical protein